MLNQRINAEKSEQNEGSIRLMNGMSSQIKARPYKININNSSRYGGNNTQAKLVPLIGATKFDSKQLSYSKFKQPNSLMSDNVVKGFQNSQSPMESWQTSKRASTQLLMENDTPVNETSAQ